MSQFIKSYRAEVGINHVPAYQVSGRPFATASLDASVTNGTKIEFPFVTRWIYVQNNGGGDVKVGFSQNGVLGTNYFKVPRMSERGTDGGTPGNSIRLELKISELYLSGSNNVDVCAGLTTIPVSRVKTDSGASFSGSVGVG